MIRTMVATLSCGAALVSACATTSQTPAGSTPVGVTHTTSGEVNRRCLIDNADCLGNYDCCSLSCVNGTCEQLYGP
jgi:hypothetical protein